MILLGENELKYEAAWHDGASIQHGIVRPVRQVQADLVEVPAQRKGK
jgi:hypothetical protein